uniref:Retrovirus-related Pol polyprotein from transposon TNT 1-94 n=1 Tax=Cajanus cajan TaxID=3821 RepID=A0A151TA09_CAJCA|nr:hypothetical protein KK1_018487 [Cajanus cajan]
MFSIKKTVYLLAAIGATIDIEDQIQAISNGHSQEYEPFITFVISRMEPYTIEEMEALVYLWLKSVLKNKNKRQHHLLWNLCKHT